MVISEFFCQTDRGTLRLSEECCLRLVAVRVIIAGARRKGTFRVDWPQADYPPTSLILEQLKAIIRMSF
jgi:hypothetical protein